MTEMDRVQWKLVLVQPGESDVGLLAEAMRRHDIRLVAVLDPTGLAVGSSIAEVLSVPVVRDPQDPLLQEADTFVHATGDAAAAALAGRAAGSGAAVLGHRDFRRLLLPPLLSRRAAVVPESAAEPLERQAESIHRSLSRIEEVLERESLLRWLLSLATRAVGATSGSLMLYEEKTEELYVAYAYGLSESTLHGTRLRLGEGIAGRVARDLRAELLRGGPRERVGQDRPDISSAVSAPLVWNERLLGVLNVNVSGGERDLDERDLVVIERLAARLAYILGRFLRLQGAETGELFRSTERDLRSLLADGAQTPTVLAGWAGILAVRLGAERLALAVCCDDGSLLVGEGTDQGETSSWYETLQDPIWREVLRSGHPVVARQESDPAMPDEGMTVFSLPLGGQDARGLLSVAFARARAAHRFHELAGEVAYLLERPLLELVARSKQRDRLERLTALATGLAELGGQSTPGQDALRHLRELACRLTGAGRCHVVRQETTGGRLDIEPPAEAGADEPWLGEAMRLLDEARSQGWRTTLLSDRHEPRPQEQSLMAVVGQADSATPGILLLGKSRLHALDGLTFTEFDGELARRLAELLPALLGGRQLPPEGTREEEPVPAILVEAAPAVGAAGEEVAREGGDESPAPAPSGSTISAAQREVLIEILRREMDRCDRYHTAFALLGFRPAPPASWSAAQAATQATRLLPSVRTSDHLTYLPEGIILLVAPEDVHAVTRLQRRLNEILMQGEPALAVRAAHAVYPGRHEDPEGLLAAVRDRLLASAP
jgi:GAF domain-containing protein